MARNNEGVVLAQSWNEIFSTPDKEKEHFEQFILSFAHAYGDSLVSTQRSDTPHGEQVIFTRNLTGNLRTIVTPQPNGDLSLVFRTDEEVIQDTLVIAPVGNLNHSYTTHDLQLPSEKESMFTWDDHMERLSGKGSSLQAIKGKPATEGWAQIMRDHEQVEPLRIGYRIYLPWVLATARKVRLENPGLFIERE